MNEAAPPQAEPASSPRRWWVSGLEWSLGPRLHCGSLESHREEGGSRLKLFLSALLDSLRCSQETGQRGWGSEGSDEDQGLWGQTGAF